MPLLVSPRDQDFSQMLGHDSTMDEPEQGCFPQGLRRVRRRSGVEQLDDAAMATPPSKQIRHLRRSTMSDPWISSFVNRATSRISPEPRESESRRSSSLRRRIEQQRTLWASTLPKATLESDYSGHIKQRSLDSIEAGNQ
jgi:hypothetical protein